MKKDTNWGVVIIVVICVQFLLNFIYAEVRAYRLQSEIRDRVDGRTAVIVHQMDNLESLITNKCSTKE